MKKDDFRKEWETIIKDGSPSSAEWQRWEKEIIAKGEILNIGLNILEFLVTILGTAASFIPGKKN